MAISDPIGDMLTRIRNAQSVGAGCCDGGTPSIHRRHNPAGGVNASGTRGCGSREARSRGSCADAADARNSAAMIQLKRVRPASTPVNAPPYRRFAPRAWYLG